VDAELLSAYHERSLTSEESASLKKHIETCPRCRQILAHLEETDAIPVESPEPVAASALATSAASRERPVAAPISNPRWIFPWRWLTPAGAIAAALLVWIVTREQKLPNVEVAKNDARATSSPAKAPPPGPFSGSDSTVAVPKAPAAAPAPLSRSEAAAHAQKTPQTFAPQPQREESNANTRGFAGEKQRLQSAVRDKDVASQKKQLASPANNAIAQDYFDNAPALDQTIDGKVENRAKSDKIPPPPPPAPPPPAANVEVATSVPRMPAESKRADATGNEKAAVGGAVPAAVPKQQQEMGGRSLYTTSAAESVMVLAKSKALGLIAAPGGQILWRLGAAGIIERSTNKGATWTMQTSGVVNDLLTGSAPSEKICWVAGRGGVILRTTDGGAHWHKLESPVSSDWTSVFAVNEREATLSTDEGAYQTTDAGLTWKKLSPE
jgi:hypothetical protein